MSGSSLRIARVIANSVHECAPDHSTHTIAVGELRGAVEEMEALYEALKDALDMIVDACRDGSYSMSEFEHLKAALKLARGEA